MKAKFFLLMLIAGIAAGCSEDAPTQAQNTGKDTTKKESIDSVTIAVAELTSLFQRSTHQAKSSLLCR